MMSSIGNDVKFSTEVRMALSKIRSSLLKIPTVLILIPSVLFIIFWVRIGEAKESIEHGRKVYNYYCYFCHGYSGDAKTLAARFLHPKPRDFTGVSLKQLPRAGMIDTVRKGRGKTAMKPYADRLSRDEISAVVDFIRSEFMEKRQRNTRYHTKANGWPNHKRYALAFPFAIGEIPLDTPYESLSADQRVGRRLYFESCISCHDRSQITEENLVWERQALSFPRFGFKPGDAQKVPDAISGATPFSRHDIPLRIEGLTKREREGQSLFIKNCAFCHAADGTGKNWIGRFLKPHPRDLTDSNWRAGMTRAGLKHAISEGLPGTSMPTWGSVLTEQEIEALIDYIARAFKPVPSGAKDFQ